MKDLLLFFNQFFKNRGLLIFTSIFISKIVMFINTVFVVKMISPHEFGKIVLIIAILGFFTPLNGFGSAQVLMKFGSQESDLQKKTHLGQYLFRQGILNQILLVIVFFTFCLLYTLKFENLIFIIILFTVRLFGFFFLNHIQADFRIQGNNKKFAQVNITTNIIMLILTFTLAYFYGVMGYAIALAISPYLSLFFFKRYHFEYDGSIKNYLKVRPLWNYGIMESIAYFLSELMFSLDIVLIALFLTEKDIALYKVAILIPMNLFILPSVFFQTDFPKIAQNATNRKFLKFYIFNYYRIFIPIGIGIVIINYFFANQILTFIFKKSYAEGQTVFIIATIGVCFAILSRILYINLNSAIGKPKWNIVISIVSLFTLIISNLLLIPKYHLNGAAMSMMITLIVSGIISSALFLNYYKGLNLNHE